MTGLKDIKLMNEATIIYLKKLGINYERNKIIKKILSDDACFFKIDKSDAFVILQDVGVSNKMLESTYSNLISRHEYYNLQNSGKIKENDSDLKIKYDTYNLDDLFKNRNINRKSKQYINSNVTDMIEYKESIFKKVLDKIKNLFNRL